MLFDRGHARDEPLLGSVFRRRAVFTLFTQKVHSPQATEKSGFLRGEGKRPVKNFPNFPTKRFTQTLIHIFLPSFAEIGRPKAEVDQTHASYSSRKQVVFPAFSGASGPVSPNILQDHFSPVPHPSAKSCPNSSSFRGDISANVFQTHYNIGVKPVGFSPTVILKYGFRLFLHNLIYECVQKASLVCNNQADN